MVSSTRVCSFPAAKRKCVYRTPKGNYEPGKRLKKFRLPLLLTSIQTRRWFDSIVDYVSSTVYDDRVCLSWKVSNLIAVRLDRGTRRKGQAKERCFVIYRLNALNRFVISRDWPRDADPGTPCLVNVHHHRSDRLDSVDCTRPRKSLFPLTKLHLCAAFNLSLHLGALSLCTAGQQPFAIHLCSVLTIPARSRVLEGCNVYLTKLACTRMFRTWRIIEKSRNAATICSFVSVIYIVLCIYLVYSLFNI